MLSRVANSLYWSSRYLERAEIAARSSAALYGYGLELQGISHVAALACWQSMPQLIDVDFGGSDPEELLHTILFDPYAPGSVLNAVIHARENARSVRDVIPSEYWEAINMLFHLLHDTSKAAPDEEHDIAVAGQASLYFHVLHGLRDNSMMRNDGWHFIRLGRNLERASGAIRIVDFMFGHPALDLAEKEALSIDAVHLATTLRMAMGYEAFSGLGGHLTPDSVADFLLLDSSFPRSAEFAIHDLSVSLHALSRTPIDIISSDAERIAGRMLAELRFRDAGEVLIDLGDWTLDLLKRLNSLGLAINAQYFP